MDEKLVFGSEEWMKELNNRVKFPKMFVIYYGKRRDSDEAILHSVQVDTKSTEPKNIKFGSVSPTLSMALSLYDWLIEGVYQIESAEDYLTKMKELCVEWDVEL